MNAVIALDDVDRRVLWACYEHWKATAVSADQRSVCYRWIIRPYADRFGTRFHPSRLAHLARLGWLAKEDSSRGGSRRYYRIADPARLADLLRESLGDRA
jgi:hypothetical protein